jgi:hypothetical protein
MTVKKKSTDEVLKAVRETLADNVQGVLDFAKKVADPDGKYTTREFVTDTVDLAFKSTARTVEIYRSAFQLLRGSNGNGSKAR